MDTETGALSVEDAVARLESMDPAPEAVEDQPTPETEEIEDDAPLAASDEDDQPEDEGGDEAPEGEDEPEQPAIDPPKSWDAEAREKFAALPRDMQEYLLQRETERDRGVSAQQQAAAEARKRAEQEAQALASFKPQLEQTLQQAEQRFADRWQGVDATAWQELARTDPNRYVQLKAEYDADVQARSQLQTARQQAEAVEYQQFAQAQTARLPEIAPHLVDPKVQSEVFDYIAKSVPNVAPEQSKWITADEFLIAWKAAQYDKAQAPQAKPVGKKTPSVKPGTPPIPMKQRRAGEVSDRFAKAPTRDNAIALLMAKER